MNYVTVPCNEFRPMGIVTRRSPDDQPQTLVFTLENATHHSFSLENGVRALDSSDGRSFALSPPLQLTDGETALPYKSRFPLSCSPVYDPVSNCTYWVEGWAVMRMDSVNVVTLVAGSKTEQGSVDGRGGEARFSTQRHGLQPYGGLVADGCGALYLLDGGSKVLRKITIAGSDAALVTTHPVTGATGIQCLAYDTQHGVLLGASCDAVFFLLPTVEGSMRTELIAERKGSNGDQDGNGLSFDPHPLMAVDKQGSVYVCDRGYPPSLVWKVDTATRRVTTLVGDLLERYWLPAILPHGGLALCGDTKMLIITGLGLEAPPLSASDLTNLAPTLLHGIADLSRLYETRPVHIRTAGETLWVHRMLLTEYSEYFKGQLEGVFSEDEEAEIELPEADPEVLNYLLVALYRGQFNVPEELLRPVTELAGRLLVHGAVEALEPLLLASTSPKTIASDLLWAERHSLTVLLPGLKAYFLAHAKAAMREEPESVRRLVEGSPELAAEVLKATTVQRCG